MSPPTGTDGDPPGDLPEHLHRPHLRPIQPIPVRKDGKPFMALRDPAMLAERTMIVPLQAAQTIRLFDGQRTIEEIAEHLKAPPGRILDLAKALDELGLLWGPAFESLERAAKDRIAERGTFPMRMSRSLGENQADCRQQLDQWLDETEDPEIGATVRGIVAPHLDYDRGWPNYAAAYHGLRGTEPPDRVVILGTNHFGIGDGVVLTQHGFESPIGRCHADIEIIDRLVDDLGDGVIIDQLDHLAEHSIELQLPWIQHCLGTLPVVAALVPDPLAKLISDDGARTTYEAFVPSLRAALDAAGGRTLFVSSADLSHVGPQFGEPRRVDDQRRFDVERHDREMMTKYIEGDAAEFIAAMQWNRNPTRWCSIGTMAATLELVEPESIELVDYRQAYDPEGIAMVTSAAMVLV